MTILSAPFGSEPSRAKLSAEERLLEVIQNGGETPLKERGGGFGGFFQKIRSLWNPGDPRSRQKPPPGSDLARLNKALFGVIVLGLALSAVNVFYFKPDIGQVKGRVKAPPPAQERKALTSVPVEEFLEPITGRSLFQPKTEEIKPVEAAPPPKQEGAGGIMENFRLVGIAWGTEPEAMIKDSQEGRTFFLKTGDELKGVIVKEILKDRIIVEFEGQTKEIM